MTSPKIHLFSFSLRAYKRRGQKNDVILCKLQASRSAWLISLKFRRMLLRKRKPLYLTNRRQPQPKATFYLSLNCQHKHNLTKSLWRFVKCLFSVLLWPRVPFKFPLFGLLEFYGLFQLDIFLFVLLLAFVFYVRFAGLLPISNFIFCSPCFETFAFLFELCGLLILIMLFALFLTFSILKIMTLCTFWYLSTVCLPVHSVYKPHDKLDRF